MGKWCVFEHDKPNASPAQTAEPKKKGRKGKKGSVAIAQDDIAQAAEDNQGNV